MDKPFLRFFCHVAPEGHALGDLGYRCATTAVELGLDVRVVSCGGPVLVSDGRWAEHEERLTCLVPDEFINVVCGSEDERERLYTNGMENVAIVCGVPVVATRPYRIVEGEEGFRDFLTNLLDCE